MERLYGGIEAGGTKFICMVGTGPQDIVAETRIITAGSDETIQQTVNFFRPYAEERLLASIGIATFGPIDLDPQSPTYGYITTTPKPEWNQVDLLGIIRRSLRLPVVFDTDVNAAAFGEQYWSPENRSVDPFLYVTVGTGIGVGVLANGRPIHGLIHTEAGHIAIPHRWESDPFPGVCPYHGDCLEGLASGLSMARRWGLPAETLPHDHPGWDLEADYIALALVNLIYAYSPRRIILGGGVARHPGLHEKVRDRVRQVLNGYIHSPMVKERISEYIIPPTLGNRSGVLGAIAMAIDLVRREPVSRELVPLP
jgi:fructokinase